jgi:PAS domain-containing protein
MLSHAHPELRDSDYVVFVDSGRRYLDCSPGVHRLLGYGPAEMSHMTIEDVSYQGGTQKLFEQFLTQGSQEGDFVLRHKNGSPVPVRYHAFVFPDGCKGARWEPINDWRKLYFAALLEVDPSKLKDRVEVALAAIQRQMSEDQVELSAGPPAADTHKPPAADKRAINDALSALKALQRNARPR